MPTVIQTCWGPQLIDDQPYWHLVSPGVFFYNNVRVGKGALLSVSQAIEAEPAIANAQTPYSATRLYDPKEAVFEEIRRTKFPKSPQRLKTLYVYDDYALAHRALTEWFSGSPKIIYECRILLGSVLHRADTVWLNSQPNEWEESAEKYWQGIMTPNPFPEILVHGTLYFPNWESFPMA